MLSFNMFAADIQLVGDSTMCDYPRNSVQQGWGTYLQQFCKKGVKVYNCAKGKIEEHAKLHMDKMAEQPERIRKLFHAETVKYASQLIAETIMYFVLKIRQIIAFGSILLEIMIF